MIDWSKSSLREGSPGLLPNHSLCPCLLLLPLTLQSHQSPHGQRQECGNCGGWVMGVEVEEGIGKINGDGKNKKFESTVEGGDRKR